MTRNAQKSLKAFILFIALIMPLSFYGQNIRSNLYQGNFYINGNIGITQYYGDLNNYYFYNTSYKSATSLILGYQISPVLGVRSQLMSGKIASDNGTYKLISNIKDYTFDLSLNINNLVTGNREQLVSIYAFGGAGVSSIQSHKSRSDGTIVTGEDNNKATVYEFVVPFGLGASLALSRRFDLNMEYRDCVLFNDNKLDRTNASKPRDYYGYASIGLTYNFFSTDNMWDLPRKSLFELFHH